MDAAVFAKYLADRGLPAGGPLDGDLRLACACALGEPDAIARFEADLMPQIVPALRQLRLTDDQLDEVLQQLRVGLFVKGEIGGYQGRAELHRWLRSIAIRAGVRMLRKDRKEERADEDALLAIPAPGDGPEIDQLKAKYAPEFKTALRESLAALDPKERTLLRQHFLDGLTIDQLGAFHGVHRATAARWITAARQEVLDRAQEILRGRLGLGGAELESLLRLVQSRLDLTHL
jgi:RNA polymerase sigma-70 factor (ECF subfamily)